MKITENPHTGLTLQTLQTKVREFDVYVKQYLNELNDEEEIKTAYANGAQAFVDWIEEALPKLNDRSTENTLADAQQKMAEFGAWRKAEKAARAGTFQTFILVF